MLSKIDLKKNIEYNASEVDKKIQKFLKSQTQSNLTKAALYSCIAPQGKRIRPFLVVETARIFNADLDTATDIAAAIEMIHTYSLIHDDLPALDNDDYRRGQLSCHKKFDEVTALLTGNSLLTFAFEIIANASIDSHKQIALIKKLTKTLGFNGMVYGQMLDIEHSKETSSQELILKIHQLKTAEFMATSCLVGAMLGKATALELTHVKQFGLSLGMIFQITDDVLDSKSKTLEECNITKILKPQEITRLIKSYSKQSLDALDSLCEYKINTLKSLLYNIESRVN